jgi:uncharacterized protein YndB with AHSA1/START domain
VNDDSLQTARFVDDQTVQLERWLPGPLERVWAYLTKAEFLRTWFADGDIPIKAGEGFALKQQADPVPVRNAGAICGTVTRCEAPRLLEYTWNHVLEDATPMLDHGSLVRFELEARGERVLLRITHGRLKLEVIPHMLAGWQTHTGILEARLRGETPVPFFEVFRPLVLRLEAELEQGWS